MTYRGLVERLTDVADADPRPRPGDDTITEADAETDGWGHMTPRDRDCFLGPRPEEDIITKETR